jgi:hypothetical protein
MMRIERIGAFTVACAAVAALVLIGQYLMR